MKRGSGFAKGHEALERRAAKDARPAPLVPKQIGASSVDKGPVRDRVHMARVVGHPCLICGEKWVQAHHIREMFPRTMGVKIGDQHTVPLCQLHHDELHSMNGEVFWANHHIDPVRWAAEFYADTRAKRGQ